MNLEERVEEHDKILEAHEERFIKLDSEMRSMNETLKVSLSKFEESNKFLREQNTRQSEQQTLILENVLDIKKEKNQQDHDENKSKSEIIKMKWENFFKIFAVGGAGYLTVEFLIRLILKLTNKGE